MMVFWLICMHFESLYLKSKVTAVIMLIETVACLSSCLAIKVPLCQICSYFTVSRNKRKILGRRTFYKDNLY